MSEQLKKTILEADKETIFEVLKSEEGQKASKNISMWDEETKKHYCNLFNISVRDMEDNWLTDDFEAEELEYIPLYTGNDF